jgi:hypothetical protein
MCPYCRYSGSCSANFAAAASRINASGSILGAGWPTCGRQQREHQLDVSVMRSQHHRTPPLALRLPHAPTPILPAFPFRPSMLPPDRSGPAAPAPPRGRARRPRTLKLTCTSTDGTSYCPYSPILLRSSTTARRPSEIGDAVKIARDGSSLAAPCCVLATKGRSSRAACLCSRWLSSATNSRSTSVKIARDGSSVAATACWRGGPRAGRVAQHACVVGGCRLRRIRDRPRSR